MLLNLVVCDKDWSSSVADINNYIDNPTSFYSHLANLKLLHKTFPNIPITMPILDNITADDCRVKFITQVCMREYPTKQTAVTRDWIPTLVGTGDGGWLLFFEDEELLNSTEYFFGITRIDEKQLTTYSYKDS